MLLQPGRHDRNSIAKRDDEEVSDVRLMLDRELGRTMSAAISAILTRV